MKRLSLILSVMAMLLSGMATFAQTQTDTTALDSASREKIDAMLSDYLGALGHESIETKISEVDFIISACRTDRVRDYVARKVYGHFLESPVMGDEAVAIHLTDKWFSPGRASMTSDIDLLNAKIFADFNRSSLLGSRAPALRLTTPSGEKVEALGLASDTADFAGTAGRYRVLYFYSPDCMKCRIETPLLIQMLTRKGYPIDLLAVDADDDKDAWDEWMGKFDAIGGDPDEPVRVMHYWDPTVESDFQRKYGVLQTPRLFLIDTLGVIVGRGLDVSALDGMLSAAFGILSYGSADSERFFDALFSAAADSTGSHVETARYLASRLEGRGELFRQYVGDMLYYLNGRPGMEAKDALRYVADSLVLCRPDIWKTADDSLKVVGLASIASDLLARADIGDPVPDLRLSGVLLSSKHPSLPGKVKAFSLRSLPGKLSYIVFYTEGCPNCEEEKAGIARFFAEGKAGDDTRKARVLMVDLDRLSEKERTEALDAFDLTNLPYVTLLDSHGIVLRRYLSFAIPSAR